MNLPAWLFADDATKKHLTGQWTWFALWLAVTVIGVFVLKPDPALHGTHTQLGLPNCYSVIIWDRPCPGCGLTTSWTATMHGNFPRAFAAHALGPILYLLYTLTAILSALASLKNLRFRSDTNFASGSLIAAILIFMAYGGIRFANTVYNDPGHAAWEAFRNIEKDKSR